MSSPTGQPDDASIMILIAAFRYLHPFKPKHGSLMGGEDHLVRYTPLHTLLVGHEQNRRRTYGVKGAQAPPHTIKI